MSISRNRIHHVFGLANIAGQQTSLLSDKTTESFAGQAVIFYFVSCRASWKLCPALLHCFGASCEKRIHARPERDSSKGHNAYQFMARYAVNPWTASDRKIFFPGCNRPGVSLKPISLVLVTLIDNNQIPQSLIGFAGFGWIESGVPGSYIISIIT